MLPPALLSILRSIICEVVAYGRLKTKENFKLLAIKVLAVAYERFQVTSNLLIFWKSGR